MPAKISRQAAKAHSNQEVLRTLLCILSASLRLCVSICLLASLPLHGDEPAAFKLAKPLDDPSFFPLAVWLQNPSRAAEYKTAGINIYVGLWRGPTEEQLAKLKEHGMYVI